MKKICQYNDYGGIMNERSDIISTFVGGTMLLITLGTITIFVLSGIFS